jgi:hypothetical protein
MSCANDAVITVTDQGSEMISDRKKTPHLNTTLSCQRL